MMQDNSVVEKLLFGELRKLTSLVKSVNVVGVFINVTFVKLPKKNRDILLSGMVDRIFRSLENEYSFYREHDSMWVFRKTV